MDNDDSGGVAGPDDEPQRCQMVHREVDEGLVHCDAMDAHQDHRNRCFGNAIAISTILRFRGPFGRMGAELKFVGQRSCWNL